MLQQFNTRSSRAILRSIWLQYENAPARAVTCDTLIEYRRDVIAFAIAFRPVSDSPDVPLASINTLPLHRSLLNRISYSYPRSRQRIGDSSWRVFIGSEDYLLWWLTSSFTLRKR
ncbi:hypothetical protein EVAR_48344_1 [Eumeta japonica]|uniref:Uncharacterized protein n=1 Tax=Eumeta variegata TaxID=151549 RepID=A0A4C1WJ40_EUMVA|nr:hypothetical protein EVAR_48344_1 [Eumeta japonica]